ncbi:MAG: type II toxin-antitoxin system antitoxin DNA ADP-ribosyl glycohydrolase DarG [Thermomicrobiales bacterium]
MVNVLVGDLFQSKAQTLVNTVNRVGVMGKGIALEFKRRFPEMYDDYVARCARGEVRLGQPYLFQRPSPPWVLNFPTKDHWRSVTKLDDIVRGLEYLLAHYREWGISSLAVPPLGCGNGQLEWRVVGPTLHHYLGLFDIPVELYAPYGTPHEQLASGLFQRSLPLLNEEQDLMPEPQWIPPAWVAIVEIVKRVEDQPYHWPIGRTIFQKIAYIATIQGLPTHLSFEKNSYGPHSSQLKQLESRLVNNGLIRVEPRGKMVAVEVGPTFDDARRAYRADLDQWEEIIARTADLFMRMTGRQAEVVSTIMFTARSLAAAECGMPTERSVVDAVMEWKQRRQPPFDEGEVAVTVRDLAALGWLQVRPSDDMPLPEDDVLLYA